MQNIYTWSRACAICIFVLLMAACGAKNIQPPLKSGEIVFTYSHEDDPDRSEAPESVFVAGDFNEWQMFDPNYKMQWDSLEDMFILRITLEKGVYTYKYIIDGRWAVDPRAELTVPDPLGGRMGIFEVDHEKTP
jgi:hypothetical protein